MELAVESFNTIKRAVSIKKRTDLEDQGLQEMRKVGITGSMNFIKKITRG